MWLFRQIKEKDPEYKRIHCMECFREQIGDYEAEQVRNAVRSGVLEGVRDGTDVPGGAGTGLSHLAAPATDGRGMIKAQRKQSKRDKANPAASIEWIDGHPNIVPAAAGPHPKGKGKGKDKVNGPKKDKEPAPPGTCVQFWDHGKCDRRDAGQDCKWEHIRSNHPSAPAYIKAGKAAPKGKAKAKAIAKSTKRERGRWSRTEAQELHLLQVPPKGSMQERERR